MSKQQMFQSVCPVCENVHLSHAGDLNLHICGCSLERKIFAHPQQDRKCAEYYAWKHPAAAVEAKAVVAQLDAGVDPNDVKLGPLLTDVKDRAAIQATFVPRSDWRKLPKKPPARDVGSKPCDDCNRPTPDAIGRKHYEHVGGAFLCGRCFDRRFRRPTLTAVDPNPTTGGQS